MKPQLEIGDVIKRFEITVEIDIEYKITSVTKTLAKTDLGRSFFRDINYNTTKPRSHYIGEVKRKGEMIDSNRYFLVIKI